MIKLFKIKIEKIDKKLYNQNFNIEDDILYKIFYKFYLKNKIK